MGHGVAQESCRLRGLFVPVLRLERQADVVVDDRGRRFPADAIERIPAVAGQAVAGRM